MNQFRPTSSFLRAQTPKPTVVKICNFILNTSTLLITIGWIATLLYTNTTILERPYLINYLNLLWQPLAFLVWLYAIVPLCLVTRSLFKSSSRPASEASKKQKLIIRILAVLYGGLIINNVVSLLLQANTNEELFIVFPWIQYIVFGIITLITAGFLWLVVGLWRRQLWTVPLVLFVSIGFFIASVLVLTHRLTPPLAPFSHISLSILASVFFATFTFVIFKNKHLFYGNPRKLWLQIPLLLLLCVQVGFAVQTQLYIDDFSVNDSDLVLSPVTPLPPEANAHTYLPTSESMTEAELIALERAVDYYHSLNIRTESGELTRSPIELTEAKTAVIGTENLVEAILKASTMSEYQCPVSLNQFTFDTEFCELNNMRDFASLTTLHSQIATLENDEERAIELATAVLELGQLISTAEQNRIINYLVGWVVLSIGVDGVEFWYNNSTTLDDSLLRVMSERLPKYTLEPNSVTRAYRAEYMDLRTSLLTNPNQSREMNLPEDVFLYQGKPSYFYLPNKTTNTAADYYRKQITLAKQPCTADVSAQEEMLKVEAQYISANWTTAWLKSNSVGNILLAVYVASFNNLRSTYCDHNEDLEQLLERIQNNT